MRAGTASCCGCGHAANPRKKVGRKPLISRFDSSAAQTSEIGDDPITVLREFDTWGFDVLMLDDREPATPQAIVEANEGRHSVMLWLRPRGKPA